MNNGRFEVKMNRSLGLVERRVTQRMIYICAGDLEVYMFVVRTSSRTTTDRDTGEGPTC